MADLSGVWTVEHTWNWREKPKYPLHKNDIGGQFRFYNISWRFWHNFIGYVFDADFEFVIILETSKAKVETKNLKKLTIVECGRIFDVWHQTKSNSNLFELTIKIRLRKIRDFFNVLTDLDESNLNNWNFIE